jgi:hypothetical protein
MTANYITKEDLKPLIDRIDSIEKLYADRHIDMQKEFVRLEEGVKGVRAQAAAHNEGNKKMVSELSVQISKKVEQIESLVQCSGRELQAGVDKIISTLGIDDDAHAAKNLSKNLLFLNSIRLGREETISWLRRGIVGIILAAFAAVVAAGITQMVMSVKG